MSDGGHSLAGKSGVTDHKEFWDWSRMRELVEGIIAKRGHQLRHAPNHPQPATTAFVEGLRSLCFDYLNVTAQLRHGRVNSLPPALQCGLILRLHFRSVAMKREPLFSVGLCPDSYCALPGGRAWIP